MVKYGRVALVLREPGSFAALAREKGWQVARAINAAEVYQTVGMLKG